MADEEPMAVVRWEFMSKAFPGVMVRGSHEMRTVGEAKKLAETMNEMFGENTHHVETMNQTYDERNSTF